MPSPRTSHAAQEESTACCGSGPLQTQGVPIRSTHQRDKGILCLRFRDSEGNGCPVANCPYAHVATSARARLPPNACTFFLQSRCLREPCSFFHGRLSAFEELRRSGAQSYAPAEHMPVRDPLRALTGPEPTLRAVDLEPNAVADGPPDGTLQPSLAPLPLRAQPQHQYHHHHFQTHVHVLHHHHHHHHHQHLHHLHHNASQPLAPPFVPPQGGPIHLVPHTFYAPPPPPPRPQLWPPASTASPAQGVFAVLPPHPHHHHAYQFQHHQRTALQAPLQPPQPPQPPPFPPPPS